MGPSIGKTFLQQYNRSQNIVGAHWVSGTETQTPCLSTDSVYGWVGASPKCGVIHPEKDQGIMSVQE